MRLLQHPERPTDGDGVFDHPNMEYTCDDAKEIQMIGNDIEQRASINSCLTNSISMGCSLIHIKPLEK